MPAGSADGEKEEVMAPKCTIQTAHCESCGSTDREDLTTGDQGYTACCNELISYSASQCRAHHNR